MGNAGDEGVQARISAFWSTVAPGYEAHGGNVIEDGTEEHTRWVEAVRAALPERPSDVLDVGCGTGYMARTIAALGHRVTGIDLAPGMLEVARGDAASRGLHIDFREGDAVAPPFGPASFDVVASRHVLWTLRDPGRAFRNWKRLLRPGGRVVAVDGMWFGDDEEDGVPPLFAEHYTEETRSALPLMGMTSTEPVVEAVREAGFGDVVASRIEGVELAGHVPFMLVASLR
ncbi:MAG TPA: class I SAM-dependent methyltransferase [Tepidiformaceae bacterium]|nr:class I SAM-dependent methyltransferase [Tepidiformaceae bacterium]